MTNKVTFDDKLRTVEYHLGHSGPIKFELNQILGIGEFTTSGGPLSDDYNLVLIASKFWYAIPMDAVGIADFIEWLHVEFNVEIKTTLANSVTEKSRMIYPEQLKDKEFIKTEQYQANGLIDKLKVLIGVKPKKILKLHSDISKILQTGI